MTCHTNSKAPKGPHPLTYEQTAGASNPQYAALGALSSQPGVFDNSTASNAFWGLFLAKTNEFNDHSPQ